MKTNKTTNHMKIKKIKYAIFCMSKLLKAQRQALQSMKMCHKELQKKNRGN